MAVGPAAGKAGCPCRPHQSARTAVRGSGAGALITTSALPYSHPRNLLGVPHPDSVSGTSDLDFTLCVPDLTPSLLCLLSPRSQSPSFHAPHLVTSPGLLMPLLADYGVPRDMRQKIWRKGLHFLPPRVCWVESVIPI